MKICSLCGSTFDDRVDFCFADGTPLELKKKTPARRATPLPGFGVPTLGNSGFDVPEPRHLRFDRMPAPGALPDPEDVPDSPLLTSETEVPEDEPPLVPAQAAPLSDAPTIPVPRDQEQPFAAEPATPEEPSDAPPEQQPTLGDPDETAPLPLGQMQPAPGTPTPLPPRPEITEDIEELSSADLIGGIDATKNEPQAEEATTAPVTPAFGPGTGESLDAFEELDEAEEEAPAPAGKRSVLPLLLGLAAVVVVAIGGVAVLVGQGLGRGSSDTPELSASRAPEQPAPVQERVVADPPPKKPEPTAETVTEPAPVQEDPDEAPPERNPERDPTPARAEPPARTEPPREDPWGTTSAPVAARRSVRFESRPAGARVALDGRWLSGVTPLSEPNVLDGRHQVRVELDGYLAEDRAVMVEEGSTRVMAVLSPVAVAKTRNVKLYGPAGSTVTMGQTQLGLLPIERSLELGSHTFIVHQPDGNTFEVGASVTAGDGAQTILLVKP